MMKVSALTSRSVVLLLLLSWDVMLSREKFVASALAFSPFNSKISSTRRSIPITGSRRQEGLDNHNHNHHGRITWSSSGRKSLCGDPYDVHRRKDVRYGFSTHLWATNDANNNAPEDDIRMGEEMDDAGTTTTTTTTSRIPSSPWDRPVLALLDAAMIVTFAAVGKASHSGSSVDGSLDVPAIATTAAPFLVSWFAVTPPLGCFTPMATGTDWKTSAISTTKGWSIAIPLGCALRGIVKGYIPPISFVIVTLIATWVLLTGGRLLYTALMEIRMEFF